MYTHIYALLLACLSTACTAEQQQQAAARVSRPAPAPQALAPLLVDTSRTGQAVYAFQWHGLDRTDSSAQAMVAACEAQAAAILRFCQVDGPQLPALEAQLYPSIEAKGLARKDTRPVQADHGRGDIALVSSPYFGTEQLGPQNALLLRRLLGEPGLPVLEEGLAVYFNPAWQGQGYRYWMARLARHGNKPSLHELLDTDWTAEASPLVLGTAAASLCDFLIQHWGQSEFLKQYGTWQGGKVEAELLLAHWKAYLGRLLAATPVDEAATTTGARSLPYLKGFNFAHEGYSIYDSYGSSLAAESLRKQQQLGANALALVPYSYLRDPTQPAHLPFMRRAGTETDESVIRDALLARGLGLKVVLKPQLWLGRGKWPGDVNMGSEEDWQAFFQHYYRWMRHYALMAEIHELDLLCVGVEFAQATLARPADWQQLIQRLRGIYTGPMTYAANWGEEFEQLAFWTDLDYIGLDCYYPLSGKPSPSDAELQAAFGEKLRMAQTISKAHGRPLLFTEIGFTSTATPWVSPHEDGRGDNYDGEAQLRCYRVVMAALSEQGDWCRGLLWWKYPSHLGNGGAGDTGFTPNGKPAEAHLKEAFKRLPD